MSRHNMTHQCLRLNHQKSFIQKSFGISRHLVTQRVKNTRKTASLGLEPRQRDPESLVLPLHHEATSEKIKTDLPCCKSSRVALAMIQAAGVLAPSRISAPSQAASTSRGFPLFFTSARACSTILSIILSS